MSKVVLAKSGDFVYTSASPGKGGQNLLPSNPGSPGMCAQPWGGTQNAMPIAAMQIDWIASSTKRLQGFFSIRGAKLWCFTHRCQWKEFL